MRLADPTDLAPAPSPRICAWCPKPIPADAPPKVRFHSRLCRQAAYRARRLHSFEMQSMRTMHMAYADPHYLKTARKRYPDHPFGEVDHGQLIRSLVCYDGWALSCSTASLRELLPMVPEKHVLCTWGKNIGVSGRTRGIHKVTESLIVVPGRRLRPGKPDLLVCQPARSGGDLVGRKPLKFCIWLFDVLGLLPGDELLDVFPGTGIVGRTWKEVSRVPEPLGGSA